MDEVMDQITEDPSEDPLTDLGIVELNIWRRQEDLAKIKFEIFCLERDIQNTYETFEEAVEIIDVEKIDIYKNKLAELLINEKVKNSFKETYEDHIEIWEEFWEELFTKIKNTSIYLKKCEVELIWGNCDDENTMDCPVCYDEIKINNAVKTKCNHYFCLGCIKEYCSHNKDKTCEPTCPLCRETIRGKAFYTVSPSGFVDLRRHIVNL